MRCSYCRHINPDYEERCQRCGRHLHRVPPMSRPATSRPHPPLPPLHGSAAPAFQPHQQPPPEPAAEKADVYLLKDPPRPQPQQHPLFDLAPFARKVISIATLQPRTAGAPARRERARAPRPAPPPPQQSQLHLFPPAPPAVKRLPTHVEAAVYCNAPVASASHRFTAALIDAALILLALGIFALIFFLFGGRLPAQKTSLLLLGACGGLVVFFYGYLWRLLNTPSPGARAVGLTILTFDGEPLFYQDRGRRFWAFFISAAPLGLGLLWAALDEEGLAWHDHISRTFPTIARRRHTCFQPQRIAV